MVYHTGPIMPTVAAYTIFWIPPGRAVSAQYRSLLNRYFQDIGGSKFYAITSQYYQEPPRQYIQNVSTLAGTWVDTAPYPNGGLYPFDFVYQNDIRQEVQRAIAINGWPSGGYNVMFFVFTAMGVESCVDNGSVCTPGAAQYFNQPGGYCAYHSAYGTVNTPVIYANMPYDATWGASCASMTGYPNDPDSDIEISTTSHEHFESVTDPVFYQDAVGFHYGWTDPDGGSGEIGDKCAYRYGAEQGDGANVILNGHRYIAQQEWSNAAFNGTAFSGCALSYGKPASTTYGDFDGDGKTDITIFRPSNGYWYSLTSSSGFANWSANRWGLVGDIPVPGDYDGDGKADIAVYRPSNGYWYVLKSSSNYTTWTITPWGLGGDVPVPGDYDGDGKTDIAVYRPSNGYWYVLNSSTNYTTWTITPWGVAGDVPVSGDFDGDGKTDIAVYRPSIGYWYVLKSSSNNTAWTITPWGVAGDVPVSGDFDGDGKTDIGIYRPSNGYWYVLNSSSNNTTWIVRQWGLSGDIPVLKP
jgi:hypothetical protein